MSAPSTRQIAEDLRNAVNEATPRFDGVTDAAAERKPGAGEWSAKQILGHLVDSASNNHGRFVRAQSSEDLTFEPYDQDRWVEVQKYEQRAWSSLLSLWRELNFHIAHVIDCTGRDAAERARTRHNLDRIAWKSVPADQPATLAYFMDDYVGHLRHHLAQIDDALRIT